MSRPNITEYHRPSTIEEAWGHIADDDPRVRLLSGGADLTIHAPPLVTTLVDLGRVLGRQIGVAAGGSIRIEAMATLTEVMEHPQLSDHAAGVIPEMMVHVGNPLLRNFSTIGGHVARGKLSDVVPVLLALDTSVELYDGATATLPLADYYDNDHHSAPHIVTALVLPPVAERSAAAFLRFARTAFDFPILNICSRVDLLDDDVDDIRIVFGATPARSQRARLAEEIIRTRGLSKESIGAAAAQARDEVRTGGGWVASAEYRTHLVGVLASRCLTEITGRLGL